MASVTPIDENASWMSMTPPAGTRSTPRLDVGERGSVAVRAVDEQDVHVAVQLGQRVLRERTQVAHPAGQAGPGQVGAEDVVVPGGGRGEAVELVRPAVVPGVGIDRHHLDAGGRGQAQHRRRTTAERADLHRPLPRDERPRRVVQHFGLVEREPTFHAFEPGCNGREAGLGCG